MKFFVLLLTLFSLQSIYLSVSGASFPSMPVKAAGSEEVIGSSKSYEHLRAVRPSINSSSRKLSFKEKIVVQLLKWKSKMRMGERGEPTSHQRKLGRLSLIFGVAAIVLAFVPYAVAVGGAIWLLSLPSAIAGLVLGLKSLKGNSNTQGLIGLILSGSYLALLILALIVLAIVLGSGGWF